MQFISNSVQFGKFLRNTYIEPLLYPIPIIKPLFFQALGCWALIERKYPNFSHSDLHTENLLVSIIDAPYQMPFLGKMIKKYYLTIIDFGYAKLNERNPQEYHEIYILFSRYLKVDPQFFPKFIVPALQPFMKPLAAENDVYNCVIIENLVGEKFSKFINIYVTESYQDRVPNGILPKHSFNTNIQFSSEELLKLPYFDDI